MVLRLFQPSDSSTWPTDGAGRHLNRYLASRRPFCKKNKSAVKTKLLFSESVFLQLYRHTFMLAINGRSYFPYMTFYTANRQVPPVAHAPQVQKTEHTGLRLYPGCVRFESWTGQPLPCIKFFRVFHQHLRANIDIVSRLSHGRFLSDIFQFFTHV